MPFDDLSPREERDHRNAVRLLESVHKTLSSRRRWTKGLARRRRFYGGYSYCLLGAIALADGHIFPESCGTGQLRGWHPSENAKIAMGVLATCVQVVLPGQVSLTGWNDDKDTDHRDLLTVIKMATAELRVHGYQKFVTREYAAQKADSYQAA